MDRSKVLGLGAAAVVALFVHDEWRLARANASGSDLRPGLRVAAPPYEPPPGCPADLDMAEDVRFPKACLKGRVIARDAQPAAGLTQAYSRRERRRWFRFGPHAVLAYCGVFVGCKATVVVRDRFVEPS